MLQELNELSTKRLVSLRKAFSKYFRDGRPITQDFHVTKFNLEKYFKDFILNNFNLHQIGNHL